MVHFPPRNYGCIQCGTSCELFEVEVKPDIPTPTEHTVVGDDGRRKLLCSPDGCPHLRSDRLCGIYELRPQACRDFPFRVTTTPGGSFVGLSFACTAVRFNVGPPVAEIERDWDALSNEALEVDLIPGRPADWSVYRHIEEHLSDQFCFPNGTFTGALSVALAANGERWEQLGQIPLRWISDELEHNCQRVLRALFAITEANGDPQQAQQVLVAQAQRGRYWSNIFQHWVEPEAIRARMESDEVEHWQDVEAFFRHLLFRKFLWGPPSVQARVSLLPLLNEMVHFWSWQQALASETLPTKETRWNSIRELERRLTFHARGWEDMCAALGNAFLQGVG